MSEPVIDLNGDAGSPRLSVILATDRYDTIRPVVRHLGRQTVRNQVEIVIVAPAGESFARDESELRGFSGVRLVLVDSIHPLSAARAAGVRAARAPLVFIGETHTYAHPGWAEALIQAHDRQWTVVAPGFGNANPTNALSWAIFLLDYGGWLQGLPPGEIGMVPTHNSAYERKILLGLGHGLERALTHGDQLTALLRAGGHRSYFEPSAKIDHLNISRLKPWVHERFLGGLLVGTRRAERWPAWRRLVYFCGSPLIPAVLLARMRKPLRVVVQVTRLPAGTWPAMALGAVISALGEMVGYGWGAGDAAERSMLEFELHKVRYASRGA
jgi:hypothetical protein